jgi:hypothetical protein
VFVRNTLQPASEEFKECLTNPPAPAFLMGEFLVTLAVL